MPAASPPMTTSRSLAMLTPPRVSFGRRLRASFPQRVHRSAGGRGLGSVLPDGPPPRHAVHGERGPALAVLAGEVDEQDPVVVLDAAAVGRVADFMEDVRTLGVGDERPPPTRHGSARREPADGVEVA